MSVFGALLRRDLGLLLLGGRRGGTVLPLGTSAEVRIHVREPQSAYPMPWQP